MLGTGISYKPTPTPGLVSSLAELGLMLLMSLRLFITVVANQSSKPLFMFLGRVLSAELRAGLGLVCFSLFS